MLALGLWGAGHNPREEALAVLKDRRVVLWPDNDSAGVTCMKRLGKKLLPVAKDVSVVVWPNAPEKADAYDYLRLHGEPALPEVLGDKLVPYARWALMQGALTGYTTAVTLDTVVAQTTWLWDNWIPNGYVTILAAEPGTGKSGLALWLVHSYLDGRPWPDESEEAVREPATRKVFWLETDDCHGALRDRIATWDVRASAIVMLGDDGLEHADLSVPATVDKVRSLEAAWQGGEPVSTAVGEPWITPHVWYYKNMGARPADLIWDVTGFAHYRQLSVATQVSQHVLFGRDRQSFLDEAERIKAENPKTTAHFWMTGRTALREFPDV